MSMTSINSVARATLDPGPVRSLQALAASAGMRSRPISLTAMLGVLATPVTFHSVITTPSGTALGGTVDLALFSDGRFTFKVHMHDSGYDPYTFRVRCAARAPNGVTVVFQTSGHTDGTGSNLFGHVDRDFDYSEDSHNPMIQAYWLDIRQASITVGKAYEDVGALHTIEDIAKDLLGFLVAEVTLGAGLALVIAASAEISDAADGNFVGPGGLVGVIVASGVVWVFGPSAIIAAVVAGVAAGAITDAMVKHRMMTEEEYRFAALVFGDTLPPRERIYITNLSNDEGHKYTWPNVDHSILLNLGDDAFDAPMFHHDEAYPVKGQLLIHELTHAWQIQTKSFVPGMLCRRLLGPHTYTPSIGTAWSDLGLEQQAATVDQWFGTYATKDWSSMDDLARRLGFAVATQDPRFQYIVNHVRLGLN
jgi:hypothetical protein